MEIQITLKASGALSARTFSSILRDLRRLVSRSIEEELPRLQPGVSRAGVRQAMRRDFDFELRKHESGSWELVVVAVAPVLLTIVSHLVGDTVKKSASVQSFTDNVARKLDSTLPALADRLSAAVDAVKSLGRMRVDARTTFVEYSNSGAPVVIVVLELAPVVRVADVASVPDDEFASAIRRIIEQRTSGSSR